MEFPVWLLPGINGGLALALIAVIHVFVAHFAVGGGFMLVHAEYYARTRNLPEALLWVKRYTRFFLLLSMVFGGVTGVGIWFIISLISPAGTLKLVHTFLYAWATEWVFFLGEIVALFVYYYGFGKMRTADHRKVGMLYALFAFLSLFMINGVVSFMLTPGQWMETRAFWDGFFNPTFWPSLVFRMALCALLSGLFGLAWAVRIKDAPARDAMTGLCARWSVIPLLVLMASAWWYLQSLPPEQYAMVMRRTADIRPFFRAFPVVATLLLAGGLVFFARFSLGVRKPLALVLLLLGLFQIGCFEWVRETARRPWVIHGVLWSNGISPSDAPRINREGFLRTSRWTSVKALTADNTLQAGRDIWQLQCSVCHGVGAPMLDILPRTAGKSVDGMDAFLTGQGKLRTYMPPFLGTPQERRALATYIVEALPGRATR